MEIIRYIALGINLAVWTVVGFICWIPLLARTTAALAAAILVSTISQSDPRYLRANFENAVSFYSRGYEAIYRVLGSRSIWEEDASVATPEIKWDRVFLELFWTLIFWGTIAFSVFGFLRWMASEQPLP
jgi:hypothetical protein